MKDSKTFRLLDLPADLRDQVFELTLRHDENAGVIAPLARLLPRLRISESEQHLAYINGQGELVEVTHSTGAYVLDVLKDGRVPLDAHICSLECLLQPALTKVNRSIREEALPGFYRINKFILDAATFHLQHDARTMAIPRQWLRGTGDYNLSAIRDLRIVWSNPPYLPYVFAYSRHQNVTSIGVKAYRPVEKANGHGYDGEHELVDITDEPDLAECVAQMKEGGLFVRAVEQCLSVKKMFGIEKADWPAVESSKQGEGEGSSDTGLESR